jgi:hypothetical protein
MAGVSGGVLAKIETKICALMMNLIRMVIKRRIIKVREAFIKEELNKRFEG